MMIRLARLVNPKYDIYRRTGLKEGMPISNQSAAQRIVADMVLDGFFIDFVEVLIKIDADGYMGRRYNLYGLNDVVTGLIQEGYVFDKISGQFFENQQERISPNWGRLKEGDERKMTLLKFDIAGNSVLVRNNPDAKIGKAYNDLRTIVNRAVTSRFGRLWTWEGDGALGAFLFGSQEKMAVFAGMEILHELFFYNRLRNPLDSPVNVRVGIHIGQIRYSAHELERLKNDAVKQASAVEAAAERNSMGVSYNVYITMDRSTLDLFGPEQNRGGVKYRLYKMGLGK
jgi:class 3 adenylate cyclase